MLEATLLEDVDRAAAAYREEAFGPLAQLSKFSDFDAALKEVDDSSACRPAFSPAICSRCSTPGIGSTSAA